MNVKRKRELITSLTFYPGIAKRHFHPKRVKAHALGREPSALLLWLFLKFGEFRITRIKADASTYMFVYFFLQPIGICGFKGSTS